MVCYDPRSLSIVVAISSFDPHSRCQQPPIGDSIGGKDMFLKRIWPQKWWAVHAAFIPKLKMKLVGYTPENQWLEPTKSPNWKRESSEPNLHFLVFQPLIFQGCIICMYPPWNEERYPNNIPTDCITATVHMRSNWMRRRRRDHWEWAGNFVTWRIFSHQQIFRDFP